MAKENFPSILTWSLSRIPTVFSKVSLNIVIWLINKTIDIQSAMLNYRLFYNSHEKWPNSAAFRAIYSGHTKCILFENFKVSSKLEETLKNLWHLNAIFILLFTSLDLEKHLSCAHRTYMWDASIDFFFLVCWTMACIYGVVDVLCTYGTAMMLWGNQVAICCNQ